MKSKNLIIKDSKWINLDGIFIYFYFILNKQTYIANHKLMYYRADKP